MFRAHRGVGVGWGGACINVHVNLLGRYVRADMGGAGWGGVGWGGAGINIEATSCFALDTSCYAPVSFRVFLTDTSCYAPVSSRVLFTDTSCYAHVSWKCDQIFWFQHHLLV